MSARALREALERAQGFRALARAFAPPRDLGRLEADLRALRARARGPLGDALERACGAFAAEAAALADAHGRLFGAGGVPLRESAYADARRVAPTELADLRGFLRAFGLEERGEAADHVASVCELASLLALKHAYALAEGERERAEVAGAAYRALVDDHLAHFVPRLAARVRAAGPPAFYAAAADALEALVAAEAGVPLERAPAAPPDDLAREGPPPFACGGCPAA